MYALVSIFSVAENFGHFLHFTTFVYSFAKSLDHILNPLLQAQARTKQAQQGQPNLTLLKDADTQGILLAIEKADKPNPTTKKQTNRSKMMMNFDLEQMR